MKLNLLKKMLLFILLPAVLGLAVLTWVASELGSRSMSNQMDAQLSSLSNAQASQIESIMLTLYGTTKSNVQMPLAQNFATMVENGLEYTIEFDDLQETLNIYLKNNTNNFPLIDASIIVNNDGIIISHSDSTRVGINLSEFVSIKTALKGEMNVATRISNATGRFSGNIAAPILNNGEIVGAWLNIINLGNLYEQTLSEIDLGSTTELYVYDKEATIIMYNRTDMIGTNEAQLSQVQEILKNKTGKVNYDFEGVPFIAYYTHIPSLDWYVAISAAPSDLMRENTQMVYSIMLLGAIIVIIITTIILLVARGMSSSINNSANFAEYIADGNLVINDEHENGIKKALKRKDEISTLAICMQTMLENLARMVKTAEQKTEEAQYAMNEAEKAKVIANEATEEAKQSRKQGLNDAANQLEEIVNIVASASEELAAQIEQSSRGAEEQASRVTETATAIEEMNSTVLEIARNASSSAEITDNTRSKALEGSQITQKCESSITQVHEDSLRLRSNMSTLAEHAQSINAIMSVISDIADQTNLLALNAAIEAARAGDAGRGFAVVADEVRKLAEKTIASTTDVANAITAIQNSTEINVKQVDTTVKRIEEATELARASGEALTGILEMADLSADGVRAIATASEEQSATSDEISQSMMQVNTIANETTIAMTEAAKAVSQLAQQSQELSILIDELKNS